MAEPGTLKHWAEKCWANAVNKGFHDVGANDTVAAMVANLHGEVSELWEAYRKNRLHEPCDKPIELTCAEEELADIVIRVFDTAEQLGIDIQRAIEVKHQYNTTRPWRHGGKVA